MVAFKGAGVEGFCVAKGERSETEPLAGPGRSVGGGIRHQNILLVIFCFGIV